MSEKRNAEDDQDPAPLQHVDAERVPAGGDAQAPDEREVERPDDEDDDSADA